MNSKRVLVTRFLGRNLVVKRVFNNGGLRDFFDGYIEVLPTDKIYSRALRRDADIEDYIFKVVGPTIPVEINFIGHLLDEPVSDPAKGPLYIGFDTMNYGMEDFTVYLCEKYLRKIAFELESINHG